MRPTQGLFHAAMLAISTMMMMPDGIGAEDRALTDADPTAVTGADLDDTDDDDAKDANPLDVVLDSCRRQRNEYKNRWRRVLDRWAPGRSEDLNQRAVNYFCVLMMLEMDANPLTQFERKEILGRLCREVPGEEIISAMTKLELEPGECSVLTSAPELGLNTAYPESEVRGRCSKMVREFLYKLSSNSAI